MFTDAFLKCLMKILTYSIVEMEDKIKLVLHNVQQTVSCHQKYLKVLENYYHKIPFEDFNKIFFKYLKVIFHIGIDTKNPYVERTLDFLAQFVCALVKANENEPQQFLEDDLPSHPFLTEVINETLKYHDLAYVQARYHSCRFITLILKHIGHDTNLDSDICDSIQDALLERILDPKASIRLQAVIAMVRLQEPINLDCPVINAYQSLLLDANPLIRKEVVKLIAPNAVTISKISERISDVDSHVRIAAYKRCSDIGPMLFKIIARQQILKCGFNETNKSAKNVFMENLLPKWLTAYNGNFLSLLAGIKLDADENDILNTEEISKQVMEAFFETTPIREIIEYLPVDENRLVPMNKLSSEVITYWSIITNFLRNSEDADEYLDNILPELTPFCNYIQRIIESKNLQNMKEWEYLDHQYVLYNLFDMAEQYDLSDEVGRRTFQKLVRSVLQHQHLQFKLAKKVIGIADKLISNVDIFTNEICQIISDIREPLVDRPSEQEESSEKVFQVAELKVKVNILQGELEDALDNQDFQKASIIQNELTEYRKKLEDFNKPAQVVRVRLPNDDPETICQCLDLLSALLQLPSVNVVSPSLATCKNEFLLPLLTSSVVEINWRVLRCLALYSLLDKSIAEEHIKVLCIPIATYRAIPNYNKFAVITSVAAVCDLIQLYGSEIFGTDEDTTNTTTNTNNTTRRRLYRNEGADDVTVIDNNNRMNVEFIIEIVLDMLDDENDEIREIVITAITKLILSEFPVNPLLISRIILKWFNPLTGFADACSSLRAMKIRKLENEKSSDKIQQKLGTLIVNYTKLVKGAREVIETAVIPTLTTIAHAPRASPLADIDIDNVLRFLAAITNSSDTMDIVHVHTHLAQSLCFKIANKPSDPVVPYLSKMLLHLEIPENSSSIKELITQAELLLLEEEDILMKGPRRNIRKFVEKLKTVQIEDNTEGTINIDDNTKEMEKSSNVDCSAINNENSDNQEVPNEEQNTVNESEYNNGTGLQIECGGGVNVEKSDSGNKRIHEIKKQLIVVIESTINKEAVVGKTTTEENITTDTDNNTNIGGTRPKRQKKHTKRSKQNNLVKSNTNKQVENSTDCNTSKTDSGSSDKERLSKSARNKEPVEITRKNTDENSTIDTDTNTNEVNIRSTRLRRQRKSINTLKGDKINPAKGNKKQRGKAKNVIESTTSEECCSVVSYKTVESGKINNGNLLVNQHLNIKERRLQSSKDKYALKRTQTINGNKQYKKNVVQLQNAHSADNGHKNRGRNRNTDNTDSDSDSQEPRRSKRLKQTLDTSSSSNKSRESEKENVKNTPNWSSYDGVPNDKSRTMSNTCATDTDLSINDTQPVTERIRNKSNRTVRNSIVNNVIDEAPELSSNGIKRRKSRGKKSQDLDSTGDTTLHTIIDHSHQMGNLDDDMTIQTPTSNSSSKKSLRSSVSNNSSVFLTPSSTSRRSNVIISETSSDSEYGSSTSSVRKSARKIKKKNMNNY